MKKLSAKSIVGDHLNISSNIIDVVFQEVKHNFNNKNYNLIFVIIEKGSLLWKGMGLEYENLKSYKDIDNVRGLQPSWFSDINVAVKYALREISVPNAKLMIHPDEIYQALKSTNKWSVSGYKVQERIVLFYIFHEDNIRYLLDKIEYDINNISNNILNPRTYQIEELQAADTTVLKEIIEYIDSKDINKPKYKYSLLNEFHKYLKKMTKLNKETVIGKTYNRRILKKKFEQILDCKIKLKAVKFATGYDITWNDQIQQIPYSTLVQRKLIKPNTQKQKVPISEGYEILNKPYVLTLSLFSDKFKIRVGSGKHDFNRISDMKYDLLFVDAIKSYIRCDGYYGSDIPSLFHLNKVFHREVCLFTPGNKLKLVDIDRDKLIEGVKKNYHYYGNIYKSIWDKEFKDHHLYIQIKSP